MQTKKANQRHGDSLNESYQQFQIVSGMVSRLDAFQSIDLLGHLIGDLWREEEMYNAVARWLKSKEEKDAN